MQHTTYRACTSAHTTVPLRGRRQADARKRLVARVVMPSRRWALSSAIGRRGARGWIWSWWQPFCALCIPETATREADQPSGMPLSSPASLASCQTRTGAVDGRSRRGHYRETRGGWIRTSLLSGNVVSIASRSTKRERKQETLSKEVCRSRPQTTWGASTGTTRPGAHPAGRIGPLVLLMSPVLGVQSRAD